MRILLTKFADNMKNNAQTRLLGLFLGIGLPCLIWAQSPCPAPISGTVDSIQCSDNGTPQDTLDDTFTFQLSVSGGTGFWVIPPDTIGFPFDSAFTFGPYPIDTGVFTVIVVNLNSPTCQDTVTVTPPGPCSTPPAGCTTPITAAADSVLCNDHGTPLDSLDDTFTFRLTASGGSGGWLLPPDSVVHLYDTAVTLGPFFISGGMLTLIVTDTSNAACTDTVKVTPPPPCSVPPVCSTPIMAGFGVVDCSDNGTSQDSLDDTFTFQLIVTGGANTWSLPPDTTKYPYDTAVTVGPYPIAGGPVTVVPVDNDDALCADTVTVTPPPPCSVPLVACDVKEIGCMKFELLGITINSANRRTYTIQVTNNCSNKLIYTAFQLPSGVTAYSPDDNSVYDAPSGRQYLVRNPNFSPFYSIRYKSTADSISDGGSDIFEYTLRPQSEPDYIHVNAHLYPKIYYEAHLNTFGCDVMPVPMMAPKTTMVKPPKPGKQIINNPPFSATPDQVYLYPNPTSGPLAADLSIWKGQSVTIQLLSAQGQLLHTITLTASGQPQDLDLLYGLNAGLYWLKMIPASGTPQLQQVVVQW